MGEGSGQVRNVGEKATKFLLKVGYEVQSQREAGLAAS